MPKHYIYIARCADKTLYTGYTIDLKNRENTHNAKKGAKYTRSRLPVKIVYFEVFRSKSKALRREIELKALKRSEKLVLIKKVTPSR